MQTSVELAPGRIAHASGALWLPVIRTTLIADVHLGYGWAQRRRGQLGPVTDGGAYDKLQALLAELNPETLVFLGDIVHAPRPGLLERELVERTLRLATDTGRVVFVRGNHDRGFARDFPQFAVQVVEHFEAGDLVAIHGDRPTAEEERRHVVVGHLHPAVAVRDDAGATQRIPVFLTGTKASVLPAFSPFAAGFNVNAGMPQETRRLLGEDITAFAATGRRIVKLGSLTAIRKTTARRPVSG